MDMDKSTQQRRRQLLGELAALGHMVRGTLVHTLRRCGRKGCRCMNGGAAHEVRYLTIPSGHSRNRTVHVERSIEARVAEGLAAHRRAKEILDELCDLNLAALKAQARAAKAAARRKGD
jgi:hypothetical protein